MEQLGSFFVELLESKGEEKTTRFLEYLEKNVKKVVVDAQLGYCAQRCPNPCIQSDIGPFDNKTNTGKYLSKEFSFVAGPTKKESEECDIVFSQATTVPPCTMAVSTPQDQASASSHHDFFVRRLISMTARQ